MIRPLKPGPQTQLTRAAALCFATVAALSAVSLLSDAALQDGFNPWDMARLVLIFVTTAWLAWGAALSFTGLWPRRHRPAATLAHPQPPLVVLVPICNEDPVATFARIAAMDASMRAAGLQADIAVLSDTQNTEAARHERLAFARLLAQTAGAGRIFYRRRDENTGRKAGNIKAFIRQSGGAYAFAVILDADSLMEGATIREMLARMQADPTLGLLQTLPRIIGARSVFGRTMQFAANFHSPVFTRGLERMQGQTGPFWGHNAIIRIRAFAESCGLPELSGPPPFGGHILSHDYVEAALLARAGWKVEVDGALLGSFEEGPENILTYAKRDRRWCQGNLQHARLLFAPGLAGWSRFVFLQGIFAYLVSLLWGFFLVASVAAAITAPLPNYFPEPHLLFPVFPDDRTKEITTLVVGIAGLLILPKLAILGAALLSGRVRRFGGGLRATASVLAEILLSAMIAPLMLLYQSRAVLQVLAGRDGGWPANERGEGQLSLHQGLRSGLWISGIGGSTLALVGWIAPELTLWMAPVCLPMLAAPLLITVTSRQAQRAPFLSVEEQAPVVQAYQAILGHWQQPEAAQNKAGAGPSNAAA